MATEAGAIESAPVGPTDPRRSPSALVDAVTTMQLGVERTSVWLGAVLVFGSFAMLGLLANGVQALAWLGSLPWWLPPALITAAAAVLVAVMPLLLLPRPVLDAWTALTRLSVNGHEAWRRRSGAPFPGPAEVDAWIAAHPGAEMALARAQVLVMNGRATEATIPDEADLSDRESRFLRAQIAWLAALLTGDDVARAEHRRRVAELAREQEPAALPEAMAVDRMTEAFEVNLRDGDWIRPMVEARRALGSSADGTVLRWMVLPRLRHYGRISLFIFLAICVIQVAVGGPPDA